MVCFPSTVQWTSIQLYFYFNAYGNVAWILLNEGQYIAGNNPMMQNRDDTPAENEVSA
jgi:hypothetical protein